MEERPKGPRELKSRIRVIVCSRESRTAVIRAEGPDAGPFTCDLSSDVGQAHDLDRAPQTSPGLAPFCSAISLSGSFVCSLLLPLQHRSAPPTPLHSSPWHLSATEIGRVCSLDIPSHLGASPLRGEPGTCFVTSFPCLLQRVHCVSALVSP